MQKTVYKLYWNFEKEEKWLNRMSELGYQLKQYTWATYYFEQGTPGSYIYRLELLEQLPSHPESQDYLRFMEETGAEVVATYIRWVYFRRPASEGAFEIYTDLDFRIRHYRRILSLYFTILCINLMIGLSNLYDGLFSRLGSGNLQLWLGSLNILLAVILTSIVFPTWRMMRRLKKEKRLRE